MEVTLLGTGDSTGTPAPGCNCATCDRASEEGVSRTRFSVHVRDLATDTAVMIDASPDFRTQMLTTEVALPDAVVVTHIHFDHLDGLGNAYRLFKALPVHASDRVDPATGESVAATIRRRYDYLDAIDVNPLSPFTTRRVGNLELALVPVDHPPLASYGVVVTDRDGGGQLSITGDTTWAIPERSREWLADADLLLADAIVPAAYCEEHPAGGDHETSEGVPRTFGSKHMTREGALALAAELDAVRCRLIHASHFYSPDEAFVDPLAVDGERYEL